MKKTLVIFLLLNLGFNLLYSQNLECEDFKSGNYLVYIDLSSNIYYKMSRNGNAQIEYPIDENESTYYEIIEWIDDCTYRLTFDESKMELDRMQKLINELGGVVTKLVDIEKNCFIYESTLTTEYDKTTLKGKICKE